MAESMVRWPYSVRGKDMSQQALRPQMYGHIFRQQELSVVFSLPRSGNAFYFYYPNAILGYFALHQREPRAKKH